MREGKKEGERGGLFVAAAVVRFSHCVPSCDIHLECLDGRRSVGRSGKIWSVEERMERLTGEFGGETCQ